MSDMPDYMRRVPVQEEISLERGDPLKIPEPHPTVAELIERRHKKDLEAAQNLLEQYGFYPGDCMPLLCRLTPESLENWLLRVNSYRHELRRDLMGVMLRELAKKIAHHDTPTTRASVKAEIETKNFGRHAATKVTKDGFVYEYVEVDKESLMDAFRRGEPVGSDYIKTSKRREVVKDVRCEQKEKNNG